MSKETVYDQEKIEADNLMEPIYRYDNQGNYTLEIGYDYLPKEDLMCHEFWRRTHDKLESIRQTVREGKSSPLVYQMEKNFLDPLGFAKLVGIPIWTLRRHLKPGVFSRMRAETLQRYADALEISVEDIMSMK